MRVLNQITFEAKDDAEALRLAGERLGKDAVILSTRTVRVGGFMGFFQRHVLMVSAGILQEDPKEEKVKEKDDAAAKERLVAFQKLLEFKQAAEMRNGAALSSQERQQNLPQTLSGGNDAARVIYSANGIKRDAQEFDSIQLSSEGLTNASRVSLQPAAAEGEVQKLREEVGDLSKRLDVLLKRFEGGVETESSAIQSNSAGAFEVGLPGITVSKPQKDLSIDGIYQHLLESDVDVRYATQWLEEYKSETRGRPFSAWLGERLRCAASDSSSAMGGRKVMLLGPTGVGKTTTIAKLAAIQALWEHRDVLLLTSDTYRIAAVDQLRTYAKILGVPIEVIFEAENFSEIMENHASKELILLDTAGRGQKDRKNLEAFETLYSAFQPEAVHLVLAANMKYKDMLDVVERMSIVPVTHVIFTKLDETVSYGSLCNILELLGRPVSFFTTGQNVPNDIEVASGNRLAGLLMGEQLRGNPA